LSCPDVALKIGGYIAIIITSLPLAMTRSLTGRDNSRPYQWLLYTNVLDIVVIKA